MFYQPMASLPLRVPSPQVLRKSYKSPKRASAMIARKMLLGTFKSFSKSEGRTLVSFYTTSRRCDWHNWGFDYKENVKVRKQAAKTYSISTCTSLVLASETPKVITMLESDFAY